MGRLSVLLVLDNRPGQGQNAPVRKPTSNAANGVSRLEFLDSISRLNADEAIVIYDEILTRVSADFRAWIRRQPRRLAVRSGEQLKDLDTFSSYVKKLDRLALGLSPRTLNVVVVGGGSVGDFGGFFASIYKRGVALTLVPSTWLAAIDSSHGGKTALNVGGIKNQIGSFYPATRVVLIRDLLCAQPPVRAQDAMSEFAKIAIIDGGSWSRKAEVTRLEGQALLWKYLRPAIESKMKVVRRDPREVQGLRQVLNLGHTVGHVFEAYYGWSHGKSVAQGLFFALEWSFKRGKLSESSYERILKFLAERAGVVPQMPAKKIPPSVFKRLLAGDKKRTSVTRVHFIFVGGWGRVSREAVLMTDILREARRQGWVQG